MALTVVSEAAVLAISAEDTKLHLRQDDNDDDVTVTRNIKAAVRWFREYTNRQPVNASFAQTFERFPVDPMVMRVAPLSSVTSVAYTDTDGNGQTLGTSIYDVDTAKQPGEVRLAYDQSFPSTRYQKEAAAITVTFVAGYGAAASSVPEAIQEVLLRYVAALYEHHLAIPGDVMHALERMAYPWRLPTFT